MAGRPKSVRAALPTDAPPRFLACGYRRGATKCPSNLDA
jgi:hypothetical protein